VPGHDLRLLSQCRRVERMLVCWPHRRQHIADDTIGIIRLVSPGRTLGGANARSAAFYAAETIAADETAANPLSTARRTFHRLGRRESGCRNAAAVPLAKHDAGWSSPVAREAHNLEVAGSNPVPAIYNEPQGLKTLGFFIAHSIQPWGLPYGSEVDPECIARRTLSAV
jgi:hypothetical protein